MAFFCNIALFVCATRKVNQVPVSGFHSQAGAAAEIEKGDLPRIPRLPRTYSPTYFTAMSDSAEDKPASMA
jgi:hypothetical protein